MMSYRETLYQILRHPSLLAWYLFKLRHKEYKFSPLPPPIEEYDRHLGEIHENSLRTILTQKSGQFFLEIGIGMSPNIERLKLLLVNDVTYTGCDFTSVCERHRKLLQQKGIDTQKIRFLPNRVGTYAWTLMELLRSGEQFDVVFLDGHHTFYIDLPAVVLGHFLLKPGGYFLLDDIFWTLNFLKRQFYNRSGDWSVYKKMYNFGTYEEGQQSVPHIKMMTEAILIEKFGYQKLEQYSTPLWWALRKPDSLHVPNSSCLGI